MQGSMAAGDGWLWSRNFLVGAGLKLTIDVQNHHFCRFHITFYMGLILRAYNFFGYGSRWYMAPCPDRWLIFLLGENGKAVEWDMPFGPLQRRAGSRWQWERAGPAVGVRRPWEMPRCGQRQAPQPKTSSDSLELPMPGMANRRSVSLVFSSAESH